MLENKLGHLPINWIIVIDMHTWKREIKTKEIITAILVLLKTNINIDVEEPEDSRNSK